MAMVIGSVAIAANGTATKTGMAEAIYDEFVDNYETDNGIPLPGGEEAVPIKKGYATLANRLSEGIGQYILTNAQTVIYSGTGALQYTPNPNNPATACDGNPFLDKFLPII